MERKEAQAPLSPAARPRATILRPRTSAEGVFSGGGYSPGPMTLLSTFFGDGDECKSFSELLAGARVDPTTPFTLPHGFSPSTFLDSPSQGQFGMTHQHMLAQITSQAVPPPSNVQIQAQHPFPISAVSATSLTQVPTGSSTAQKLISLTVPDSKMTAASFDYSHSEQKLQSSSSVHVDKPNDDGYNWRKYGQKHVKGSDFSRSYYKCTHPKCPVKKKLERSLDGHVTAIIYKGEHSHQPPNPSKLTKDTTTSNENSDSLKEGMGCSQATGEHGSGTSDSEEVGDHEIEADEKNDEPDAKRRNTEASQDPASLHRTAAEPRIIVQTTSEVDLLDDGYRWRKYGQKVVKGNPYPRSHYKCTTTDCNVRKHVERASTDPKAVITTYEGKHNHDVPAAKTNSHTLANNNASQAKAQNAIPNSVTGNEHRPVASLRLKDEQLT